MQSREGLPEGQEGLCSTRGLGKILHVMHGGMGVNGRSHTLGDGRREGGSFDGRGDIKHILYWKDRGNEFGLSAVAEHYTWCVGLML